MKYAKRLLRFPALVALSALSACNGTTPLSCEPTPIAPELMTDCPALALASEVGFESAHEQNTAAYYECRAQYDALREAVK